MCRRSVADRTKQDSLPERSNKSNCKLEIFKIPSRLRFRPKTNLNPLETARKFARFSVLRFAFDVWLTVCALPFPGNRNREMENDYDERGGEKAATAVCTRLCD